MMRVIFEVSFATDDARGRYLEIAATLGERLKTPHCGISLHRTVSERRRSADAALVLGERGRRRTMENPSTHTARLSARGEASSSPITDFASLPSSATTD